MQDTVVAKSLASIFVKIVVTKTKSFSLRYFALHRKRLEFQLNLEIKCRCLRRNWMYNPGLTFPSGV